MTVVASESRVQGLVVAAGWSAALATNGSNGHRRFELSITAVVVQHCWRVTGRLSPREAAAVRILSVEETAADLEGPISVARLVRLRCFPRLKERTLPNSDTLRRRSNSYWLLTKLDVSGVIAHLLAAITTIPALFNK